MIEHSGRSNQVARVTTPNFERGDQTFNSRLHPDRVREAHSCTRMCLLQPVVSIEPKLDKGGPSVMSLLFLSYQGRQQKYSRYSPGEFGQCVCSAPPKMVLSGLFGGGLRKVTPGLKHPHRDCCTPTANNDAAFWASYSSYQLLHTCYTQHHTSSRKSACSGKKQLLL